MRLICMHLYTLSGKCSNYGTQFLAHSSLPEISTLNMDVLLLVLCYLKRVLFAVAVHSH